MHNEKNTKANKNEGRGNAAEPLIIQKYRDEREEENKEIRSNLNESCCFH